jgi:hypothetical protein
MGSRSAANPSYDYDSYPTTLQRGLVRLPWVGRIDSMSPTPNDAVVLTIPRSAVPDVIAMSGTLLDRMHELLERNADAALSPVEQEEAQMLVELAQFGQIVALA